MDILPTYDFITLHIDIGKMLLHRSIQNFDILTHFILQYRKKILY